MNTTLSNNSSAKLNRPLFAIRDAHAFADHEPCLWRAVIVQALLDAASSSRKSEARRTRSAAMDWLLSNTSDFELVCDNAGLDPDYVRSRARAALARGFEWRLPVGQGWRVQARLKAQRVSRTLQ